MTPSEKLQKIAENEQTVFTAGKNVGYSEGYNVGYDEGSTQGFDEGLAQGSAEGWQQGLDEGVNIGKTAQYDEFWDGYQQNGERTDYSYAFYGEGWNNATLHPKYKKITPFAANYMFRHSSYQGDITDVLDIDFSQCANLQYCFNGSMFTRIGVIDARGCTALGRTFQFAECLKTIDKIILSEESETAFGYAFDGCYELENIEFEGDICYNIDFRDCEKLTKKSIVSIIEALHPESTADLTLSETAVNNIDWTGTVIDGVTYNTFDEVANTKSDWTIALA